MATYPYECESCEVAFEIEMRMSEYDSKMKFACPNCASEDTFRVFTVPYVNFSGDGWVSKNNRVAQQMKDKNNRLKAKEREQKKEGMAPSLVPNVGGERVDSWNEAAKLAKSKGKDPSGYEQRARQESKTS
jgi:putative FmdB family regulatory protein